MVELLYVFEELIIPPNPTEAFAMRKKNETILLELITFITCIDSEKNWQKSRTQIPLETVRCNASRTIHWNI